MSSMLSVGVSGLLAYQRSLQTVSHNIANANTEGYSRQRVDLGTQPALFMGNSYIGNGVTIQGVNRIYDSFLTGQVRTYTSSFNQADTYASNASQIDQMLADPKVGLMPAVQDFFSAVQGVSNDPSSLPSRQAMVTQGGTLVDRFNYLDKRYEDMRNQVNQQVSDNVSEINSLAHSIAQLNHDIVLAPGPGSPNDLLDTRDKLLNQLSEKVAISTVQEDNGAMDVFIGKGQTLVLNFDSHALSVTRNQYDGNQNEVSIDAGAGSIQEISSQLSGGKLGGLLDFRNNILAPAQNSLGALAIGMSDTFNAQHLLGQDLNGNLGTNFFNTSSLQVLPKTGVAATATVSANISNSKQLTNDEYVLRYTGGTSYTMTRSSDNTTFNFTGGPGAFTTSPAVDGFTLNINPAGAVAGDSYLIRPGKTGASLLSMAISDPRLVAAASPIQTQKTISNTGNGQISAGSVTNTANTVLPGAGGFTLTYNALTVPPSFSIAGTTAAGGAATLSPASYVNGGTILINDPGNGTGIAVQISGTPANGDTFTIGNNTTGVSDNRNGLLLGQLQTQRLLGNGNANYGEFYGNMVADVGIKTNQARITKDSQSGLMDQAQSARDALSGVNLDEEAANLVKFQQAYQAASQIIVTTNSMFQSLIAAIRG